MKLSDVRKQIDELIAKEGDIELGSAEAVSFHYMRETWTGPWHTRFQQTGMHWVNPEGGHFIGTEETTERKRYTSGGWNRPTDAEMGKPVVREVRS